MSIDFTKLSKRNLEIGVGLNKVDNLTPSRYFYEVIESSKSYDEIENKLKSYYETQDLSQAKIAQEMECDFVANRIAGLFDENGFSFSYAVLKNIHKRLFNGVFKGELNKGIGEFRTRDISKKEPILNGDSVVYAHYRDIESCLAVIFKEQKAKNLSKMSFDEVIVNLADFTSNLWQIHPFSDGNTRTTAMFITKMLKSMGFKLNDEIFKENSLYFRNALVLSSYNNIMLGVGFDLSYLQSFFKKFLIDENLELKNLPNNIFENRRFEEQKPTQIFMPNEKVRVLMSDGHSYAPKINLSVGLDNSSRTIGGNSITNSIKNQELDRKIFKELKD